MKNNRTIAIVAIVLLIITIVLIYRSNTSTIKRELRDFALKDTALVTKIFMVDKSNQSILLERGSHSEWVVNKKFPARKDAVDLILKTLNRMRVKSPVPKAAFNTVVRNMATSSVKVEVYTNGSSPEKVFYVGGTTQDYFGTYMMLENSSTPFVMHIPGFAGYLSSRFFLDESQWRSQTICKYTFEQIASIKLLNNEHQDKSFSIESSGKNRYALRTTTGQDVALFDTLRVKQYIAQSKKLAFERFATEVSKEEKDSVFATVPIYTFLLTDRQGKETQIDAYLRPNKRPGRILSDEYKFDIDRMFARINQDTNLVIIQYFNFDPLFIDIDYFTERLN